MVPSTERVARTSRILPTYAQFPFDQWAETRYRPGARKGRSSGAFDRRTKSAAIGIVKVLVAMQDVNSAASERAYESGEDSAVDRLRSIIASYNNLRDQWEEAAPYLNPNVRRGLEQQVEASEHERLCIRLAGDGSLELDELALRERYAENEEQVLRALSDDKGLPAVLKEATARYIGLPVSQLINDRIFDTKPRPLYPPRMQAGMQLSMTGILLDLVM